MLPIITIKTTLNYIIMKFTLIRLPLKQLWNIEYCVFVSRSVAIMLKYKPETLHLKKAFDRVNALTPELDKIKAQELGNAISNQMADLNNERRTVIKAVMDQTKKLGKLSIAELATHVSVMNRFLDKHGRDIGDTNYTDNTGRFNNLLTDYNGNAAIKAAAVALQLSFMFDHLSAINTQFISLDAQRTSEESAVEKVDSRAIRVETDKALTDFYHAFEFCSTEYETLDYKTPGNELNELNSNFKAQLKARDTRRQEGKEVHKEDPITPETK